MKRGTPDHPKTRNLMNRLDLPRWGAVGILESIWHFTARYAVSGHIGKHPDKSIALGIEWEGDEDRLISALVDSGWLDRLPNDILYVHDWHDHSDDTADKYLARNGLCYANGSQPRRKTGNISTSPDKSGQVRTNPGKPEPLPMPLSKPEPDKPHDENPLLKYPELNRAYPSLLEALKTIHKHCQIPKAGTKADFEWRGAMAKVIRLDKYTETDVIESLKWLFSSYEPDGEFDLRKPIQSFGAIRKKWRNGAIAFSFVYDGWKSATKSSSRGLDRAQFTGGHDKQKRDAKRKELRERDAAGRDAFGADD